MATIATKPATHHISTPVAVIAAAVLGVALGLILGATISDGPTSSPQTSAQVAADNALVDRWMAVENGGTREDVDAILRPNFRYEDTIGLSQRTAAGMWAQILDSRGAGMVHTRTTDVARVGDVLFWGARLTDADGSTHDYTWMARLDADGRFVNAWATVQ